MFDLKPCPFCGSKDLLVSSYSETEDGYDIELQCPCGFCFSYEHQRAIGINLDGSKVYSKLNYTFEEAWNRRDGNENNT